MPALFAVTGIPFAPIRVREKRMNTYKTPKSRCGYQNQSNKVVKKVLQMGTYFRAPRITNQEQHNKSKSAARKQKLIGGSHGCKVEQYRGQHNGANWDGSGWVWRVASDWLRLAGGVKAEFLLRSAQLFLNVSGAKRQVSDSGNFRVFD